MPGPRRTATIELLVGLDRGGSEALHHQIEQQLREAIRSGRLGAHTVLPSTRGLAGQLGVARAVVVEAYEQLIAEGYLVSRPGGSTRVAPIPVVPERTASSTPDEVFEIDLRPGRPEVTEFPRAAWLRSTRRILANAPAARFSYLDGSGMPELRIALAAYLDRVRGTCSHPEAFTITSGFLQAVHIVARVLAADGAKRMAVEEPYDPAYRVAVEASGLEVVPVPVDSDGLRTDVLVAADVQAVIVTPAHQFPTGAVLTPERRSGLLAWAAQTGALILEDDYDAEFRYDREPIGAMQGLDPDHVIYAGTASKSIAPGLRLGWLIAPSHLTAALNSAKHALDHGTSALEQLILADIIERGELDRHLRHMRPIYRERRDVMLAGLAEHLPQLDAVGASAGLHVLALLPAEQSEVELVGRAAAKGVRIYGVAPYYAGTPDRGGIVFGYGTTEAARIVRAMALLGASRS